MSGSDHRYAEVFFYDGRRTTTKRALEKYRLRSRVYEREQADGYGGREMHSVFALSDFRKRIPKIDSLSKRIPKMDWWPRDAFRIRIIRFSKTDSLSKRILKMDSL